MKLALQILLYILAFINGFGFIGEGIKDKKPPYLVACIIFILLIVLINNIWR